MSAIVNGKEVQVLHYKLYRPGNWIGWTFVRTIGPLVVLEREVCRDRPTNPVNDGRKDPSS